MTQQIGEPGGLPQDLFIVSDLHMGRGINPQTRRFFALENFFYDDDFLGFCAKLCLDAAARERPFTLLLNGDTFDLLRIETLSDEREGSGPPSRAQRRFGPVLTPLQATRTVGQILAGHRGFVAGLAQVLNAGHKVVFLPGNHDLELQWEPVQEQVRTSLLAEVTARYGEAAAKQAADSLSFRPWYYYEPQRLWVEHGCQYDPENSFRYLLREGLVDLPDAVVQAETDLPLGNFFQRYLYNFFGNITFIVPSSRANLRYLKWLLVNQPRLLLRVAISHGPFVFQVLRRLSRAQAQARQALGELHQATLERLARQSGLGHLLIYIDSLKESRANAVSALRTFLRQGLRIAGLASLQLGLAVLMWTLSYGAIASLKVGLGMKAMLFLALNLLIVLGMVGLCLWSLLASRADVPVAPLRGAAEKIASCLDVPLVCFGHSHDEELWRLRHNVAGTPAWYGNTGTWIAVFTHDVLMPRERVQYTFLRVRGHQAELMHWSPGRGEPMPVILLDHS